MTEAAPLGHVEGGCAGVVCHTSALSCMATVSSKQAHHHPQQALLHYLVYSERATSMQARRFASVSSLAGATRGQSAISPTCAGSQAVVESTPPRPGHVLHQWSRDIHTTLRPVKSHYSMPSELTPLYNQQAYTTL